jgi:hypothetical protein
MLTSRCSGCRPVAAVLVTDIAAMKERNALLAEYSLEDTKAYLQWEALRLMSPYLSPEFVDVQARLDPCPDRPSRGAETRTGGREVGCAQSGAQSWTAVRRSGTSPPRAVPTPKHW